MAESEGSPVLRALIVVAFATSAVALLVAAIGAVLALITGHARWIELAWLSIAASLFAIVVSQIWPELAAHARDDNKEN
jgi:zinc transporter ZupT